MLRLQFLNQLSRASAIPCSKKATKILTQTYNVYTVSQKLPLVSLKGSTRSIFISSHLKKYKGNSGTQNVDSDDDEPEFENEKDSKVIKTNVNSLRTDLLLKAGLGLARNKVENIFYESRIRVNGNKLVKKSMQVNEGDEIDVIRSFSPENPLFLVISRVILLSATDRVDGYKVHLRRYNRLLVENYSGINAFKSSAASQH